MANEKIIAVIGPEGGGKSLFSYNFSLFLNKRGISTGIANMDPECRHIKYKPFFDIRQEKMRASKGENLTLRTYYAFSMNERMRKLRNSIRQSGKEWVILDFRAGADQAILHHETTSLLSEFADCIIYLEGYEGADDEFLEEICRIIHERTDRIVIPVVNEREKKRGRKVLLSAFTFLRKGECGKVIRINAVERNGFPELLSEIKALLSGLKLG